MATKTAISEFIGKRTVKTTWALLANGDVGDEQDFSRFSSVTIQVKGTLGVGGSVSIEGTNDAGTTRHVLNDSRGEGNVMTFTALDSRKLQELPLGIRPNVTAGDGTTSLTVIAIASRPRS